MAGHPDTELERLRREVSLLGSAAQASSATQARDGPRAGQAEQREAGGFRHIGLHSIGGGHGGPRLVEGVEALGLENG
jgi:hypothetical protein